MQKSNCLSCGDYWINTCAADQYSCYNTFDVTVAGGVSTANANRTCPYEICRYGILSYFIARMNIFVWCVLALVMLTFLAVVCSLMLLCFNKRDTIEEMMRKSGAIKKKASDTPGAPGHLELTDKSKSTIAIGANGNTANKATMQVSSNVPKTSTTAPIAKAPVPSPSPNNTVKVTSPPVAATTVTNAATAQPRSNPAPVTTQPQHNTAVAVPKVVVAAPTTTTTSVASKPTTTGAAAQPQKKMINIGAMREAQNAQKKKGWFS